MLKEELETTQSALEQEPFHATTSNSDYDEQLSEVIGELEDAATDLEIQPQPMYPISNPVGGCSSAHS